MTRRESTTVRQVVELACLAPSIYNTQPWDWRIRGRRLELRCDAGRRLAVTDPDGRLMTISCGAALQHARVAAAALGWSTRATVLPDPAQPALLAALDLTPTPVTPLAAAALATLRRRRTDRRRFTGWPLTSLQLEGLVAPTPAAGAHVVVVQDPASRSRLESIVATALTRQRSDPARTREQQLWTDHGTHDGVPSAAARAGEGTRSGRPGRFDPSPRDLGDESPGTAHHQVHDHERVTGSDGLLVICTRRDDPPAWLAAGETLGALCLAATDHGLSLVPLSQVIELEASRTAVRDDVLGGLSHPQLLARVGWQEVERRPQTPSPRRLVDDVLSTRRPWG